VLTRVTEAWGRFAARRPSTAQFVVFLVVSNGITVLQLALMPALRWVFAGTSLVSTTFQVWSVGTNPDGTPYYVFDYAAGALPGGGGGLAYFLAVQITLLIAQVINFCAQRRITFRSNSSVLREACWYAIAYVIITLVAAALQGVYKAPVYALFIDTWGLGATGETLADFATMIVNAAVSFWVFFPIFKVIFRVVPEEAGAGTDAPTRGDRVVGRGDA
jgi:putative flippase GtrA